MDSLLSQPFHCPPPRPSLPFAQLTGILTIRHDTAGQRAIWEFNVDQMQKGSLSGLCEGINPSSRLDSRLAALFILLIPSSPPLWNSLYCRGLVPPESGVLTPLRTVRRGGPPPALVANGVRSDIRANISGFFRGQGWSSLAEAAGGLRKTAKQKAPQVRQYSPSELCVYPRNLHTPDFG